MADWPVTLPQKVKSEGFQEEVPNTLLRSEMDAGPAKVRRRFTAGVRNINLSLNVSEAQVAILDNFFINTLAHGSVKFNWVHPRTQATVQFRFVSPPQYTHRTRDLWDAVLKLEILP